MLGVCDDPFFNSKSEANSDTHIVGDTSLTKTLSSGNLISILSFLPRPVVAWMKNHLFFLLLAVEDKRCLVSRGEEEKKSV